MKKLSSLFVLTTLGGVSALSALAATGGDDAAAATDKAFVQAYEKGDMAAVKKLWTRILPGSTRTASTIPRTMLWRWG